MFSKACIPLDGSYLAEEVLPYLQHLMPPDRSELLLISNLVDTSGEMKEYLRQIARHLPFARVETQITDGEVAGSILEASTEFGADLIALSSHGRSGIARAALGSVAHQIVQAARQPVFLAPPQVAPAHRFARILVPLDGSELSQRALPLAQTVAGFADCEIVLMTAIEQVTSSQLDDLQNNGTASPEATDVVAEAQRNLAEVKYDMSYARCTTRLAAGKPAQTILAISEHEEIDLIVQCTHGRTGYDLWRHGSVASELMHSSTVPILIIGGAPIP